MGLSKLFPCLRGKDTQRPNKNANRTDNISLVPAKTSPRPDHSEDNKRTEPLTPETLEGRESPTKKQESLRENIPQRVWNRAYDELANDPDTKDLVEAYTKLLPEATKSDDDKAATEKRVEQAATDMQDPERRLELMQGAVKAGTEKISNSRTTKATMTMSDVSDFVLKFKDVIDLAVKTNPQAALPWAGVCICLQFLLNPAKATKSNLEGIAYVTTRMEWYCSLSEHLLSKEFTKLDTKSFVDVIDKLENGVLALYKALLLYQIKSVCSYYRNQGWIFLINLVGLDGWDDQLASVKKAEAAVQKDSDDYNKLEIRQRLGQMVENGRKEQETLGDIHLTLKDYIDSRTSKDLDEECDACLRHLYKVDPREQICTIEGKKDKLLPEAYEWVLRTEEYQAFTDWSDNSSCQVLWLKGPAGTGKTMLTIGIIFELLKQSSKLAPGISYFFCQAEDNDNNSATGALRSLMWLLLMQQPHLVSHLIDTHKRAGESMFNGPNSFYSLVRKFQNMLADVRLSPVYLVLDALDECAEGRPGVEDLISLLISDSLHANSCGKVKWLLSGRPEIDVYKKLINKHPGAVTELDVQSHEEPVNAYIAYKLVGMKKEYGYRERFVEELEIEIRNRAQNIFLWVALVFKDLVFRRLKDWQAVDAVKKSPKDLTSQYAHMMAQIDKREESEQRFCKAVLGVSCFAFRPLSYQEVHVLAGLPPEVPTEDIIRSCGSLLTDQSETVHLLHNSTREWLVEYFESCQEEGEVEQIHLKMAERSLDSMSDMSKGLKYNMYDIDPATELKDIERPASGDRLAPLRYSCEFWVDHLCGGASQLSDDEPVLAFLETHFLHWLESLSLLGKLPIGIQSLRMLLAKAKSTPTDNVKLVELLKDCERFTMRNLSIMTQAPLQIYGSALLFSPSKSEIKSLFWESRLPFVANIAGVPESWDPCIQTISVPWNIISFILFSPDGKHFASAGHSVQLWDAAVGVCVHEYVSEFSARDEVSYSHLFSGECFSIAFSPNGSRLLVGYWERLWLFDVATGACQQWSTLPHSRVNALGFISDGERFLICIAGQLQVWNTFTWTHECTLDGYIGTVESAILINEPKPRLLVKDGSSVKRWDLSNRTCVEVIEVPNPTNVVFSPDGDTIVSFWDREMSFWDAKSNIFERKVPVDEEITTAVFLAGGKTIAIGTSDGWIWLIDLETNACIQTYNHGYHLWFLGFDKGNGLLVSVSVGLVRVWDLASTSERPSPGNNERVALLKISPDGKMLASVGGNDRAIKLWDPASKSLICTFGGHDNPIYVIDFTLDGTRIVSLSVADDGLKGQIRVWDTRNGICQRKCHLKSDILSAVLGDLTPGFSPDGTVPAVCEYKDIRLWDTVSGEPIELDNVFASGGFFVFSFSTDGKTLATFNFGQQGPRIWDVASGTSKQIVSEGQNIRLLALSPDAKTLAALGYGEKLQIWDVDSGNCKQNLFIGFSGFRYELSFTADGKYLKTNREVFAFADGVLTETPDLELSRSLVRCEGEWVIHGGKELLWLPPDYRPEVTACHDNLLAVGGINGQVVFVEFANR